MCGIAGILTQRDDRHHLEPLVQQMQQALHHRGPDDRGLYISPQRQAGLAHTRLSILDLSAAGHQPMSTVDGRYWITFNGEIYNFQQLRHQLQEQGEQFQSQTDTEVILKLYQRQGERCLQQLRGMFAFAIWDEWEQTCFIARDPLGIKPLYYWRSGSTLVFASELRAVLASKFPTVQLSATGLYGYLLNGYVSEPYTLIENIQCLPAGHWLRWHPERPLEVSQYWQIQFTPEPMTVAAAQEKVRAVLVDSIKHHFVSDVPVGLFLSGGIDSTAVVALARQTQTQQLKTYSIAFAEDQWNEGTIARRVAAHFDTNHTEFMMTAAIAQELFAKFLASVDQPSVDGFNTFCVSQIAAQDGTKVVLSGLGGDEFFGGYRSFQTIPKMVQAAKRLQPFAAVTVPLGLGVESFSPSPRLKRLGDFLQQSPTTAAAYNSFRGIFSHREACAIAKSYVPEGSLPERQATVFLENLPSLADEVSLLELSRYMRNQLLRDSDVMSMTWGLELRVPLVDRVAAESIFSIPSVIRLAPGKKLLIQALPELPDWVVNRPKQGFTFPFQQWLETDWSSWFQPIAVDKTISLQSWYRRWSLLILQNWWERISG
jgi:asparagine synthase (glutamine-hydrolysing)